MQKVYASNKGGRPYQWSARKAQLVSKMYKDTGGKFSSKRTSKQLSLKKWTDQDWTTKTGKPSLQTGERYLPRKAIRKLTNTQYRRTTAAKRAGMRKGKQFVRQPKDVSKITRRYRQGAPIDNLPIRAIHMNDSDKSTLMKDNKDRTMLIWFYAPWCGHCQAFAPVYDEVYEELKDDDNYAIMCVNIDDSPEMSSEFNIERVPTVYKINNKKKTMHKGGRTRKDIIEFAKE
jgi:thiol-disulfide isomerase/thioredoxin